MHTHFVDKVHSNGRVLMRENYLLGVSCVEYTFLVEENKSVLPIFRQCLPKPKFT